MTYCYYRVIQKHSRSRKAHDVFDSLSHLRLVTMDPAVGTERLIVPPRAFASSQFHIFQQFGTDRAKPSAAMMLPFAIKADHQGYNFRFLLYFHTCLFFPFIYAKTPVPFPSDQTSIFLPGTAAGGFANANIPAFESGTHVPHRIDWIPEPIERSDITLKSIFHP